MADNSVKYNPDTKQYIYHGNSFPDIDGKFSKLMKKQENAKSCLQSWLKISDHDSKKLITLYPMLDANLFYDYLSNTDIKIFSEELFRMSKDMDHYSSENMNFFGICSDYFKKYLVDPNGIIENEDDLKFEALVDKFLEFNANLFKSYENVSYENVGSRSNS